MRNLPPGAFSAMLQREADESLVEMVADRAQEWLERMTGDELLEMLPFQLCHKIRDVLEDEARRVVLEERESDAREREADEHAAHQEYLEDYVC